MSFLIGIIVNALAIVIGGLCGTLFGHRLPRSFTDKLTGIFGICAIGMGISSIILMQNMPPVILAVVVGSALGLALHLGDIISAGGALL